MTKYFLLVIAMLLRRSQHVRCAMLLQNLHSDMQVPTEKHYQQESSWQNHIREIVRENTSGRINSIYYQAVMVYIHHPVDSGPAGRGFSLVANLSSYTSLAARSFIFFHRSFPSFFPKKAPATFSAEHVKGRLHPCRIARLWVMDMLVHAVALWLDLFMYI